MSKEQTVDTPDQEDFTDSSPNPARDIDLAIICDALQEHGIRHVLIRYDGSGDSGSVDEVIFVPGDIPLPNWVEIKLREVAEGYCPAGYANNDGGYGTLTVYPFEGLATLEHCDRFEDTEDMGVSAPELPETLRAKLIQAGITSVTARFNGYGDSGEIEELSVEPAGVVLPGDLEEELGDLLIEHLGLGWENNAGSFGDFTIDVETGEIGANAYWRVENESAPQETCWKWRQ